MIINGTEFLTLHLKGAHEGVGFVNHLGLGRMSDLGQDESLALQAPLCKHEKCSFPEYSSMALMFSQLGKLERSQLVRSMLLVTTTPKGEANPLRKTFERSKKRKLGDDESVEERTRIVYACRGHQMCRKAFASMVSLSDQTVQRHAEQICSTPDLVLRGKHGDSRRGKIGPHRLILAGFFRGFGDKYADECPVSRYTQEESPLKLLPSDYTYNDVYKIYVSSFQKLVSDAEDVGAIAKKPESPISFNLFRRYWRSDSGTLRIAKQGSDYCDLCTALKDDIKNLPILDERHLKAQIDLENHRAVAQQEFNVYRQCQKDSANNPNGNVRHLVFDFAEKVLLPRLRNQPGQLHFVTGLKFDLFGVSCSNAGTNFVFGLPEGHWPNEKTANVVISMLHHVLSRPTASLDVGHSARHLKLHADNCSGQNKNRFVLWYLCWRVFCGLNDQIDLYFLISGHTKNVCDGAFGLVKRQLRLRNARCPRDMMKIIQESSQSTSCVPGSQVTWRDWKKLLGPFFSIPSNCLISKYHVFTFKKSSPGVLFVQSLTSSQSHFEFNLLSKKGKQEALTRHWPSDVQNSSFYSKIVALEDVPSSKHETRKQYLQVNILDRYYKHDASIQRDFFGDGDDPSVSSR